MGSFKKQRLREGLANQRSRSVEENISSSQSKRISEHLRQENLEKDEKERGRQENRRDRNRSKSLGAVRKEHDDFPFFRRDINNSIKTRIKDIHHENSILGELSISDDESHETKKTIFTDNLGDFNISITREGKTVSSARAYTENNPALIYDEQIYIEFYGDIRHALKTTLSKQEKKDFRVLVIEAIQWAHKKSNGDPKVHICTTVRNNPDALRILQKEGLTPSVINYKIHRDKINEFAKQSIQAKKILKGKRDSVKRTIIIQGYQYTIEPETNLKNIYENVLELVKEEENINKRYTRNLDTFQKNFPSFYEHRGETNDLWLTLKDAQGAQRGTMILERKDTSSTIMLSSFYLQPEIRRQGIGKAFFIEAMHIALHHLQAQTIRLGMISGNRAQSFYETRLGLTPYSFIVDQGALSNA